MTLRACLLILALCPALPARQDPLPAGERELFEFAERLAEQDGGPRAVAALEAFLSRFPKSDHREAALQHLAGLVEDRQPRRARSIYLDLVRLHPSSPQVWERRRAAIRTLEREGDAPAALVEFGRLLGEALPPEERDLTVRETWRLRQARFHFSLRNQESLERPVELSVEYQNLREITLRLYKIPAAIVRDLRPVEGESLAAAMGNLPRERMELLEETRVELPGKTGEAHRLTRELGAARVGTYVVEGDCEGAYTRQVIFRTRLGLVLRVLGRDLVCFVQDRRTGVPVEGAEVRLPGQPPGRTGPDGLFKAAGVKEGVLLVLHDGEYVAESIEVPGDGEREPRFHISTDRPIYRPGQVVHFRAVIREQENGRLLFKPGARFVVDIFDPKHLKVLTRTLEAGAFGALGGSFVLGRDPVLGGYEIKVRPDGPAQDLHWAWEYPRHPGSFRVEEYRRPEFKVDVEFEKSPALFETELRAVVKAEYFSGGPVVGAEVEYRVFFENEPAWVPTWPGWAEDYLEDAGDEDYSYWSSPHSRTHGDDVKGTAMTDPEGKAQIRFPGKPVPGPLRYRVRAEVTDLSRRKVSGEGSVVVYPAGLQLQMREDRGWLSQGEEVRVDVLVRSLDGRPLPGAKVALGASRTPWFGDDEDKVPVGTWAAEADAEGRARFRFAAPGASGRLILEASASDRDGRTSTISLQRWVCSSEARRAGEEDGFAELKLMLDRKTYRLGETAKLSITGGRPGQSLLLLVETDRLKRAERIVMRGDSLVVDLPVEGEDSIPNFHVAVASWFGDRLNEESRAILVDPTSRHLTLDVRPAKAEARPGERVRCSLSTLGADGRPVAAEVAVGVVDESIYLLAEDPVRDIRRTFQPFRHRKENSRGPNAAMAMGGVGFALDGLKESPGAYAAAPLRRNFAETALWTVATTGADGTGSVEIELPDTLTNWRITARAVSADSRFGQTRGALVTRKKVQVRPLLPRFLVKGDVATLSAVVHNDLPGEQEFQVEVDVRGLAVQGERSRTVKVPSGGRARLDWTAAAAALGTATLRVDARSAVESDAVEIQIPVHPHGSPRWASGAGLLGEAETIRVEVPADTDLEASELVLGVSPVHGSMMLDALDELAGYPYGCTEQTMSRFLPTLAVSRALAKLGVERPKIQRELPLMIAAGVQRLATFQHGDGGWGWWERDESNPWITAYVAAGLGLAVEAREPLPGLDLDAAAHWMLKQEKAERGDLRIYLLHGLAALHGGLQDEEMKSEIRRRVGQLVVGGGPGWVSSYGHALALLARRKLGLPGDLWESQLSQQIRDQGKVAAAWWASQQPWMADVPEASAVLLRAQLLVDPKDPVVAKLVNGLGLARRGAWWTSTRQTAQAVIALTEYLAQPGRLDPDLELSASLNGTPLFTERVTGRTWAAFDGVRRIPGSRLKPGPNEIRLERRGTGAPAWSWSLRTVSRSEDLPASEGDLRVARTWFRLLVKDGELERVEVPPGTPVRSGEEIEVELELVASADAEWLMLEDPLPAGFEPVREHWGHFGWEWSYWYTHKEFHDDRVSVAMDRLAAGRRLITYRMRAETPGDFHAMPARIFDMYEPSRGATSSERRVKVVEK